MPAPVDFSSVPGELLALPQWVAVKYAVRDGKPTKLPVNPKTGRLAETDNPATWNEHPAALRAVARFHLNGVGFCFTDADPRPGKRRN
jgi:putative DNA primase/helicase